MNTLNRFAPLVGRTLIALIFVLSGLAKVTGFDGTVGYIASKGLPLPQLAAIGAIIVELGGGLLLIFGWKARWAATAMLVFTAIAAFVFLGSIARSGAKPDDPLYEKYFDDGRLTLCGDTRQRRA